MDQLEVLVIGRDQMIMETVVRLINKNPYWHALGSVTDETAIELFHQSRFDMVLLGGGIEEASEKRLRALFTLQNPGIMIIQHFGGGSGLLSNEIMEALEKKKTGITG